jgi:glycosyltransferase involved in cell wall biosynthesis
VTPSNLTVLHTFAPAPIGGAEQVVADLTEALALEGCAVHLVPVLDEGGEDHPFLSLVSSSVQTHPLFLPPRSYLAERRALRSILNAVGPAIVHTHGYRSDLVGGLAARAVSRPVLSTVHGFTGGGIKNQFYERLQRWALRRADGVIAVSDPLAATLRQTGVEPERLHVIRNARSLPRGGFLSPDAARGRLWALCEVGDGAQPEGPRGDFHIGWVGRMSPEKGPDVLVEALAHMEGGWQATFVGSGPLAGDLRARCRDLELRDRIGWAGPVPEAARHFKGFDVLVLSSRSEGTPIVLLEAMAAGVPLVVTRVGGIPDVVTEREALIVDPEDPRGLADAIARVRDHPEAAKERVDRAKLKFETDASTKRWAREHIDLYLKISGLN